MMTKLLRAVAIAALLIGLALTLRITSVLASDILSVYFFDAQSNKGYAAILIQTPGGMNIVLDSGPEESANQFLQFLLEKGVSQIDYLIASHSHADHIGLHDEIIKQYGDKVKIILDPGLPDDTAAFTEYIATACAFQIPFVTPRDGDVLHWGPVEVTFYNPTEAQVSRKTSAEICGPGFHGNGDKASQYSLVFKVQYGGVTFLLPGDVRDDGLSNLMARHGGDLVSTVLELPEHGGDMSPLKATFLQAVFPTEFTVKIAVAMASRLNKFGHPCDSVLAQLAALGVATYFTGVHGTVTMMSDGQSIVPDMQFPATTNPAQLQALNNPSEPC